MSQPVHFVIGSGRSGTTLLRVMLAGHPGLFSPPEMVLAPYDTMAQRAEHMHCLLYTSPSPRDLSTSRMPSSA